MHDVAYEFSCAVGAGRNNRPFSQMAAELNSNMSKLKMYTSTRKNTFTLVALQSFSLSGVISAEKMQVENWEIYRRLYDSLYPQSYKRR